MRSQDATKPALRAAVEIPWRTVVTTFHNRQFVLNTAVRFLDIPTNSRSQVESAQCIYDLCEVLAMVILNREIGHSVRVALRDDGIGNSPR